MTQPKATGDAGPKRLLTRVRILLLLAVSVAALLAIVWHLLLPEVPDSSGTLTERDRKQIARLCRMHTVRHGFAMLRKGEVRWFIRSSRVFFEQKIDRFIADRDGTYRICVVVYDKQAPDGFNPWMRHQMTKTNGHWTILRSY